MNIILSNLFDNAIEASRITKEKVIRVSMKYAKGIFCIKISNSHNNLIKKKNNNYITTKSNSKVHGYGINNVKHILEKYNGNIEVKHDNHIFVVTAIMYI